MQKADSANLHSHLYHNALTHFYRDQVSVVVLVRWWLWVDFGQSRQAENGQELPFGKPPEQSFE